MLVACMILAYVELAESSSEGILVFFERAECFDVEPNTLERECTHVLHLGEIIEPSLLIMNIQEFTSFKEI